MKKRVVYLDYLKLLLTICVIIHHTCQAYTLGGDWMVKDVDTAPHLSGLLAVNMSFLMGLFFFISGYFVPSSRENRSRSLYASIKARRLLVPIIGLLVLIVPVFFYIAYCNVTSKPLSFVSYYFNMYWGQSLFSYEHGWFLLSLFIYCMIYLLVEKVCNKVKGPLTVAKILVFAITMAVLTVLIRLVYPIDEWVDVFGIIGLEPAHLPQYFLWFIAGTMANKNQWTEQITKGTGRVCLVLGLLSSVLMLIRDVLPMELINGIYSIFPIYETLMSVTISIGLLYLFRKYVNKPNKFMDLMAGYAFDVYLIHNLFVIISQVIFCRVHINGYVKFMLATLMAILCSFLFSMVWMKCKRLMKKPTRALGTTD